jgi:DNA-binding LytR/AlgR family response regulator
MGSRLSFASVENVAFFYTEGGVTFLVESKSSQKYIVDHSLNDLESSLLDPQKFYRINRSIIINLDNLVEMKPYQNGRLVLSLNAKSEEAIVVARERVNEFKSWINQ